MEGLPQIIETVRLPVHIQVHPYLLDHRFEGKAVLPAVETMQLLANTVKSFRSITDITGLTDARFNKFLNIEAGITQIAAFCDMTFFENGDIGAALVTKRRSPKSTITRANEHGGIRFPSRAPVMPKPPFDPVEALNGACFEIPAEKIYRDLVPFGTAYHNIHGQLRISENGAAAKTHALPVKAAAVNCVDMGSPFPLDAAFHAACVWGQRYAQVVAFPIGIEKRVIFEPTIPGTTYLSRIVPVRKKSDLLTFDIWIYGKDGQLYEGAWGVQMRDVSAGRLKPPRWIRENIT
jgi:hypothetical protein